MTIDIDWNIDPEDVGCSEYSEYRLTAININEDKKEIWSVNYSYTWDCGDGCCSDTERAEAHVGELSKWLKKRILEKYPEYKFEKD